MNQENIIAIIGISCFAFITIVFLFWSLDLFKKIRVFFKRVKIYSTKSDLWENKSSEEIQENLVLYKSKSNTDPLLIKVLEEALISTIKQEEKEEQKRKEFEMFGDQDDFLDKVLKLLGTITGLIIGTILWGIAILITNALLTLIIPAIQVSIPFAIIVGFIVAFVRYIQSKSKK